MKAYQIPGSNQLARSGGHYVSAFIGATLVGFVDSSDVAVWYQDGHYFLAIGGVVKVCDHPVQTLINISHAYADSDAEGNDFLSFLESLPNAPIAP